ncbi:MAG TPA: TonB family protein [Terracidiphilus sp.]|nr:TonB family protein [Terracidiphilus sp.]
MTSITAIPKPLRASIGGGSDGGKTGEESQGVAHHAGTTFGDLLVVADEVGYAAGGSRASRMAVDAIASGIAELLAIFPPRIAIEEAVRQANTELTAATTLQESSDGSMGVTVVVALLRMETDRARATIGRVGDSRAYVLSKQKLAQITADSSGPPDGFGDPWTAAQDEASNAGDSAQTACLGQGLNIKVATSEIELQAGDGLLLCTGGLWRSVSEQAIERVLADHSRSADETSRALLDSARNAGAKDSVAIEFVRLTQGGDSAMPAVSAVENQSVEAKNAAVLTEKSGAAQKKTATPAAKSAAKKSGAAPVIEWAAPEPIEYGTALSDVQLSATASVEGTFTFNPEAGAMLVAGEHTLSVVFAPTNKAEYAPAQATVPLRVAKSVPSINWPEPEPINDATPLGPAQLNAGASASGSFAYSPRTGELLRAGTHTLSVKFTPADLMNYTAVEASVPLTVIEAVPAAITWESPDAVTYGTALGDEQLNAMSPVPGTFLYVPAPGSVLTPGQHELEVFFTPEDKVRYAEARATVTLQVEEPEIAQASAAVAQEVGGRVEEPEFAARIADEAEGTEREPQPGEDARGEMQLFRSFQPDVDVAGGQKRASLWWRIASVVAAIPILCVLAFLIDKARTGTPFLPHQSKQTAPAAVDVPPSAQDATHRVQIIVNQTTTGDGKQPAASSGTGSGTQAAKPAQGQSETTYDKPAVPTKDSQGGGKQASEPANTGSGRSGGANAGEQSGRSGVENGKTGSGAGNAAPVYVSGDVAAGRLLESRVPIYPPAAKANGISGTVELEATIGKDGAVKDARVVSGPAELRQAAINCVRAWRYRPFMVNNEPTEAETTVNVVFSLDK